MTTLQEKLADASRNERLAKAYSRLEGSICNVVNMAALASDEVEGTLEHVARQMDLDSGLHDQTLFAVFHLQDMLKQLKAEWYAAFQEAGQ